MNRYLRSSYAAVALLVAACAGSSAMRTGGATTAQAAAKPYEGKCAYVGLEQVSGPTDTNSDSASFVARYRFDDPEVASERPFFELAFQVSRSRADDLRAHLESHPTVLCTPERVDVPPFR